eukprot:TRINITY_DN10645_c0_g1_i5.p1 TRINITY_DN10645_c0_g1~~TRINITY_DN10645_c0_g1_i5.p1  ORF type:complete len:488 (-),score=74.31 TRINITY_DN10645_c0_g1_i5:282-1745(-)
MAGMNVSRRASALLFVIAGVSAMRNNEETADFHEQQTGMKQEAVSNQEEHSGRYSCQSWCVRCSSGKRLYFRRKEDWKAAAFKTLNYMMGFTWFGDGLLTDWAMYRAFQGMSHNASKLQNTCNSVKVSTLPADMDEEVTKRNHLWGKHSESVDLSDLIDSVMAAASTPEENLTAELLKLFRKDSGQLYRVEAEDTNTTHTSHRPHAKLPDVILMLLDTSPAFCGDGQPWTEGQTSNVASVWEENAVEGFRDTLELGFTRIETTSQRECFEDRSARAIMPAASSMVDELLETPKLTNVTDLIEVSGLHVGSKAMADGGAKLTLTFHGPWNIDAVTEKVNLVEQGRVTKVGKGPAMKQGVQPGWLIVSVNGIAWKKLKEGDMPMNDQEYQVTFMPTRVMCCCDSANQPPGFPGQSRTKPTGRCQVMMNVTKIGHSCAEYGHPVWARGGELRPYSEGNGCLVSSEEAGIIRDQLKAPDRPKEQPGQLHSS